MTTLLAGRLRTKSGTRKTPCPMPLAVRRLPSPPTPQRFASISTQQQTAAAVLTDEQLALREDLAAAHWATNHFGMDDLVWNHISARCSDGTILITPGELLWDAVTPDKIVKQSDNSTANVIHEAIYDCGREDIRAVVHLHTRAAVAISCMEPGSFEFLDQNSTQFLGEIAYHEYEGLSDDAEGEEKRRIAEDMRLGGPSASVLVMRNHGYCTVGRTVGEAWTRAWCLPTALPTSRFSPAALTVTNCIPHVYSQAHKCMISLMRVGTGRSAASYALTCGAAANPVSCRALHRWPKPSISTLPLQSRRFE